MNERQITHNRLRQNARRAFLISAGAGIVGVAVIEAGNFVSGNALRNGIESTAHFFFSFANSELIHGYSQMILHLVAAIVGLAAGGLSEYAQTRDLPF